jgi:hypothetical protein
MQGLHVSPYARAALTCLTDTGVHVVHEPEGQGVTSVTLIWLLRSVPSDAVAVAPQSEVDVLLGQGARYSWPLTPNGR